MIDHLRVTPGEPAALADRDPHDSLGMQDKGAGKQLRDDLVDRIGELQERLWAEGFRAPSANERDRDYLWRLHRVVPRRGEIGIFNRSHELYEETLTATSTDHAPWHVVPADRKWVRDVAVTSLLVQTLEAMDPQVPPAAAGLNDVVVE